ncbi:TPA: DNA cytosine methyltransferase, partial [Pseudomonas aeruginosa]|nr:DNA cytosine methyltransferase [Pseudomonas aeruginosa]
MTAYIHPKILTREIRHFHLFCGLGGGAKGFNKANPRVGNLQGKFRCIGGIDVNAAAIRDFERLSGSRGTVLDLFDRDQFKDFHGKEPPREWREATAADIRHAAGGEYPHIVFLSAPCKGFSGLLSENRSKTAKYQALNRLTLRGVWLMLEAFQDDLPELIVFENVPRIQNRGRRLLDQIVQLLRRYGYATAETTHDCGELGGLAQSRKRFLLVGRNINKVPDFIYEPVKKSLRSVGDILGRMPLPGHFDGGPMHRVPNLFFKTWLRLAFVEAGKDWRSLNRLNVEDGVLTDYLIVPEQTWRDGALGVHRWDSHAGTVTGRAEATTGRFSVADPRRFDAMHNGILGVHEWADHSGTVTGNSRPMTGAFAVADPRPESKAEYAQYGVM